MKSAKQAKINNVQANFIFFASN